MRYLNCPLITAADVTSNQTSSAIDTSLIFQASAMAALTGSSPVGTIKLQASNDRIVDANLAANTVPTNWADIPNTTVAVTDVGTYLIPKTELSYQWIRLVWTKTSGTGTITANLFANGF